MHKVGVSGTEGTGIFGTHKNLFVNCVEAWIYYQFSDTLSWACLDLV